MICKKCGSNIEDTSKFCGYCGNKVDEIINLTSENTSLSTSQIVENNVVENSVQYSQIQNLSDNTKNVSVEQNQSEQLNSVNETEQTVVITPENGTEQFSNSSNKKKSYTWIFILGGVLLGIIIVVILFFAFFNKSSNSSLKQLERALNNISERGKNSGTVNAQLLMVTNESDTYDLSANVMYAKNSDNYDIALTLNKSMLYDEMKFYSTITDDSFILYAKSSLIDMLGLTSANDEMWVYFLMDLNQLEIESEVEENITKYNLSDILDKDHYKLIDEENGVKHYQLIIDNKLINKIKSKMSEDELKEFEESLNEINSEQTELTDVYYLDIYINNSNELVKISMDLTEQIDDESFKKVVISFEFSNLGNTLVEIPNGVKSTTMDLETYISTYSLNENSFGNTSYEGNYYNYVQ